MGSRFISLSDGPIIDDMKTGTSQTTPVGWKDPSAYTAGPAR